MRITRWIIFGIILLVITTGLTQFGQGSYIKIKAVMSQLLLDRAWEKTQAGDQQVKPWPWADTWPLARMIIPSQNTSYILLAGDSGRTLAFGPGHHYGSVLPGEPGNSLISAHRDTHFRSLQFLKKGDELALETPGRVNKYYRIEQIQVMSANQVWVVADEDVSRLTLVTCYPFDALQPGTALRYVITAVEAGTEGELISM